MPAVALLIGLCIVSVGRSRAGVAGLLLLFAFAATPNYLAQRGPYAKEGMDYSQWLTSSPAMRSRATA